MRIQPERVRLHQFGTAREQNFWRLGSCAPERALKPIMGVVMHPRDHVRPYTCRPRWIKSFPLRIQAAAGLRRAEPAMMGAMSEVFSRIALQPTKGA